MCVLTLSSPGENDKQEVTPIVKLYSVLIFSGEYTYIIPHSELCSYLLYMIINPDHENKVKLTEPCYSFITNTGSTLLYSI